MIRASGEERDIVHGQMSISFTSDWHCGTGQGRHGGIDRLVRRDADDLPFVPAKTLLGLWREDRKSVV